jgi:predicted flap endonuclease-1-like 5' DNA nuclease
MGIISGQDEKGIGGRMNPVFTFVLGLLIGWLIEWLIDYFYWRRRYAEKEIAYVPEIAEKRAPQVMESEVQPAAPVVPDDLKVIKGIGPVIERKLNGAGIYTYEQLGNLTVADLRRILGNVIERLSDEDALLRQARDLASRK